MEDKHNQHDRYMIKIEEAAPTNTTAPNKNDERNNTGMIIHGKKEELKRSEDKQWIEFFENCTNNNTNNLPDSVSSSTCTSGMINNNTNETILVWGDGTKTNGLLANTSDQQQQQQQQRQANVATTITTVTDCSIIPTFLDGNKNKNKNKNGADFTQSLPTTKTPAVSVSTEEII